MFLGVVALIVVVERLCLAGSLCQNIFDQMWTGLSYAEVTALRKRKLEWQDTEHLF